MSLRAYQTEYLKQLRKMNAMKAGNITKAQRLATGHGGLTTFKSNDNQVSMPVKEYEVLINAQDALKEMMRGIADGEKYKESQKLKLFHVFVTFPQADATNAASTNKIEMTILSPNKGAADLHVTQMLDREGYTDLSATLINIEEIEGPFESGFVISRYGW